jgi:hypothetical protein
VGVLSNEKKSNSIPTPKTRCQSSKSFIDDVLDWIRKNDVSPESIDDPTALALADLAQVDNVPFRAVAPDQKRP